MASTPQPPPFENLTDRPFSFFPPIVGIEHNEWLLKESAWSEMLVTNRNSGQEIWIPRRYVGEVSRIEDPVVIVGLTRELEYKGGMLVPFQQRVLKMPGDNISRVFGAEAVEDSAPPPSILGVRLDPSDRRVLRLIGMAVGFFILLYVVVVTATRIGDVRGKRVVFTAADTSYQELTPRDDRFAVVNKLGNPGFDRLKQVGTITYEALSYPDRKYTVLLMGDSAEAVQYIGTMDESWKPIHSVSLRSGGTTHDLLRNISRF